MKYSNPILGPLAAIILFIALYTTPIQSFAQNNTKAFAKAFAFADSVYKAKDYKNALAAYTYAARLNPNEPKVTLKISELQKIVAELDQNNVQAEKMLFNCEKYLKSGQLDLAESELANANKLIGNQKVLLEKAQSIKKLIEQSKALENTFNTALNEGENYLKTNNFELAIKAFENAKNAKPSNPIPAQKIEAAKSKREANRTLYNKEIAQADAFYIKNDYNQALTHYKQAQVLLPDEKHPTQRITDINEIQNYSQTLSKDYELSIKEADEAFTKNDFSLAAKKYKQALDYRPDEEYPKAQLKKMQSIQADNSQRANLYASCIQLADGFYKSNNLKDAFNKYEEASKLQPSEKYPIEKMKELTPKIALLDKNENLYASTLASADESLAKKDLDKAKTLYSSASKMKPEESYPKTQLALVDQKIADKNLAYQELIKGADQELQANNLDTAKVLYTKALIERPNDTYPAKKIAEINKTLASQKSTQQNYESTIAKADIAFESKNYTGAKTLYSQALQLIPQSAYPTEKLTEIASLLKNQQELESQYNLLVTNAQKSFSSKDYTQAKSLFQEALALKPLEKLPKERLNEIDKILNQLKSNEEAYALAIQNGDLEFANGNYEAALLEYNKAFKLKPSDLYAGGKKAETENRIAIAKSAQQSYAQQIKTGEALLMKGNLIGAREAFSKALEYKAGDDFAKSKIAEIDATVASENQKQQLFDRLVAKADSLFIAQNYTPALDAYTAAQKIKPSENHPKARISTLKTLLEAANQKEKEFNAHVKSGNDFYTLNEFNKAKAEFELAIKLKPTDELCLSKLDEIDTILAQIALTEKEYATSLALAERLFAEGKLDEAKQAFQKTASIKPTEKAPNLRISEIDAILLAMAKKDENYKLSIANGTTLLEQNNLEAALAEFNKASLLKPEEALPKQKVTEIKASLEQLAQREKEYNELINNADKHLKENKLTLARDAYSKALALKPVAPYPTKKISTIDSLIAVNQKIDSDYLAAVKTGDQLFEVGKLDEALTSFNTALNLKPAEEYPKSRISVVTKLINDKKQAEEDAFNLAMANGDQLFKDKQLEKARLEYSAALLIKPSFKTAQDKIVEIDRLIALQKKQEKDFKSLMAQADSLNLKGDLESALSNYNKALDIKPLEKLPKDKITEITAILQARKDKEAQFAKFMADGAQLKANGQLTDALAAYKSAQVLKPEHNEVKVQITQIETELARIAKVDADFQAAKTKAEAFEKVKQLNDALTWYKNALVIKPSETEISNRINNIQTAIAKAEELESSYKAKIASADSSFAKSDYQQATLVYTSALELKPTEVYPAEKIKEINKILANKQLIERKYAQNMATADSCFKVRLYNQSLSHYLTASKLKPLEEAPKTRIQELNQLLTLPKEVEGITYEKAILAGNQALLNKEMDKAFDNFLIAKHLEPHQTEPASKLLSIIDQVSADTVLKVTNKPLLIKSGTNATINFSMHSGLSKSKNYLIIKLKEPAKDDAKIVVNFGKIKSVTGGLVIRVLGNEKITTYIGYLSGQNAWKENANNFLTLLAERGDINIEEIYISTIN